MSVLNGEEYVYVKCQKCGKLLTLRSMLGKIYIWRFGKSYGAYDECKCGQSIRKRDD